MAIPHKFYASDFGNGYVTQNAILQNPAYKPEVMIVGTFNPGTPNANFADFFYGRNFFWPAFKNLFFHNAPVLLNRRMPPNGAPPLILQPTLFEILDLCSQLKLTFSDLILKVLHNHPPPYQLLPNDNIMLDGHEYNLIQDGQMGNVGGLQQLNVIGQVHWNTVNIIRYLLDNPHIKAIYFTRRPTGIWQGQWNQIVTHPHLQGRLATNIFTPSGAGAPVHRNMENLLNHWVHNVNPNFGRLDYNWLIQHGVQLNNF